MATTTNYGWTTPDDTALVKDGASAIRTLGSSVDTTTKNLNPSTTLGDIEYRSSTSNVNTRLGLGTAGQVLTVNSGATAPEWASIAAGGMTLLETLSLTGSSVTSSSIAGTYKDLYLIIRNFRPANAGNLPKMRFNSDSGTRYATIGLNQNSLANQTFNATSLDAGFDARSDASTQGLSALTIYDYANATTWKMVNWQMFSNDLTTATNWNYRGGRGIFNQTGAITTITLLCDGSGFTSGSALIYGVK
jgi:hypothetical protein